VFLLIEMYVLGYLLSSHVLDIFLFTGNRELLLRVQAEPDPTLMDRPTRYTVPADPAEVRLYHWHQSTTFPSWTLARTASSGHCIVQPKRLTRVTTIRILRMMLNAVSFT